MNWKPFKFAKLECESVEVGSKRGDVFAPTNNPNAPKPVYWNVIDFKGRKPLGMVASGFCDTTDEAKTACAAAMGF